MKSQGHPRRPSILITPDFGVRRAPGGSMLLEADAAYAEAIQRVGGLPCILAPTDDRSVWDCLLERAAGLLLTGGDFDIAPEHYHEAARPGLGPMRPERTAFELAFLRAALARRLPILGIGAGMQLINVALGGTLVQDLRQEVATAREHRQAHAPTQPSHPVDVRDRTALSECVGRGQLMVNSTHHQAVARLGEGLVVSATAPDGVVEAVESVDRIVLGVQWHPELLMDSVPPQMGIFKAFINRARDRRHG